MKYNRYYDMIDTRGIVPSDDIWDVLMESMHDSGFYNHRIPDNDYMFEMNGIRVIDLSFELFGAYPSGHIPDSFYSGIVIFPDGMTCAEFTIGDGQSRGTYLKYWETYSLIDDYEEVYDL